MSLSVQRAIVVGAVGIGAYAVLKYLRRPMRLYVCGQQSAMLQKQLSSWIGMRTLQPPIKVAFPPFNRRSDVEMRPDCATFNAPVFGPAIANATMAIFAGDEMAELAASLGVKIPHYELSAFVQKKSAKVKALVSAAKAREDCKSGANAAAIARLEGFVDAFGKVVPSSMASLDDWRAFVDRHVANPGEWETNLHFDHVLTACFGFEAQTAAALRATEHEEKDAKTGKVEVSKLEHYSVRWLSKGLGAYGPVGCLGDAVNLVLAMQNEAQPEDVSERVLVAALKRMKAALDNPAQLDGLWLPTHLQHDCELDDTLSWLLLERVRQLRGGELKVLVQLPPDTRLDVAAAHFASKGGLVFRDDDSRNAEAVLKNVEHM